MHHKSTVTKHTVEMFDDDDDDDEEEDGVQVCIASRPINNCWLQEEIKT